MSDSDGWTRTWKQPGQGRRSTPRLTILTIVLLLTSCGTDGPGNSDPAGCLWVRPIYLEKSDLLGPDTQRAILAHNRKVAEICGVI